MRRIESTTGVDLHLHTTASDGRWTPTGLVRRACKVGISVMAVTDHDTTDAYDMVALQARVFGIEVIAGVELTTEYQGSEVHLLLYGRQTLRETGPIAQLLRDARATVQRRARAILDRTAHLGPSLQLLRSRTRDETIQPVALRRALLQDGCVQSSDGFGAYVTALGGIPPCGVPLLDSLAITHAEGVVSIIAHPCRDGASTLAWTANALRTFITATPHLSGIEVEHPSHSNHSRAMLRELITDTGLLASVGSDSHGPAHAYPPHATPAIKAAHLLQRLLPPDRIGRSLCSDFATEALAPPLATVAQSRNASADADATGSSF